jgi:hypothetical protein
MLHGASDLDGNFRCSPNIVMGGARVRDGEVRNVYEISVGKPEATTPLGRPRRR